jgi:hypothetical protein
MRQFKLVEEDSRGGQTGIYFPVKPAEPGIREIAYRGPPEHNQKPVHCRNPLKYEIPLAVYATIKICRL